MLQRNTKTGKTREIRVVREDDPRPPKLATPYGGPLAAQALDMTATSAAPPAGFSHCHGHSRPECWKKPVVEGRPVSSPPPGTAGVPAAYINHGSVPFGHPGSPPPGAWSGS